MERPVLSRNVRHTVAQRLFWSRPGRALIRLIERASRRWNYVVMNRSLNGDVNGEIWLAGLLPPDALVVDIGFNRGDFTALVLHTRPAARAIAFEPARSMQRRFEADFPYRERVRLLPYAVSNRAGSVRFQDSADGVSHILECDSPPEAGGEMYDVPVVTLDEQMAAEGVQQIDFLKIDAEGFDCHVLEGCEGLLRQGRIGMLMFEYNEPWIHGRRFLKDAVTLLEGQGYRLYSLFNGFLAPFQYSTRAERHDLGCNYVALADWRIKQGGIRIQAFP